MSLPAPQGLPPWPSRAATLVAPVLREAALSVLVGLLRIVLHLWEPIIFCGAVYVISFGVGRLMGAW